MTKRPLSQLYREIHMYACMYKHIYIAYVPDFMHKASPIKFNRSMPVNISLANI